MMVASEDEEAWCPPTFTPSTFSRMWLAWWMVQLASHSTFFSSSPRIASSFALGLVSALSAIGTICSALRREAKSAETANLGYPDRHLRINPLARPIFVLTRVTRIFQKNVFTKTTPAGPAGAVAGFCCAHASAGDAVSVGD